MRNFADQPIATMAFDVCSTAGRAGIGRAARKMRFSSSPGVKGLPMARSGRQHIDRDELQCFLPLLPDRLTRFL